MAASPDDATIATIIALEKKWSEAETNNTPHVIEALIADRAMLMASHGRVNTRASFMADERATHYSISTVEDVRVAVFGTTAIANYLLHQQGTYKGVPFDRLIRETDTWIKMPSGNWQVVAAHGSDLKKD
jgi:ketosteroid isomerase-like protein